MLKSSSGRPPVWQCSEDRWDNDSPVEQAAQSIVNTNTNISKWKYKYFQTQIQIFPNVNTNISKCWNKYFQMRLIVYLGNAHLETYDRKRRFLSTKVAQPIIILYRSRPQFCDKKGSRVQFWILNFEFWILNFECNTQLCDKKGSWVCTSRMIQLFSIFLEQTLQNWAMISPVRLIDMKYRLPINRHFWKISILVSISQFWNISI